MRKKYWLEYVYKIMNAAFSYHPQREHGFHYWLYKLQSGFQHGSELADILGSDWRNPYSRRVNAGLPDNVYEAEKILKAAIKAGLIKQCDTPSPTKQQQFFGCGGRWDNLTSPVVYGYEPTTWSMTYLKETFGNGRRRKKWLIT